MKHKETRETYDRLATGVRLHARRNELGWSRKYVAEKIGVVERYYADIERGTCGMSVETLMGLTQLYGFSMDYLIYGSDFWETEFGQETFLTDRIRKLPPQARNTCKRILMLFMEGYGTGNDPNTESQIISGIGKQHE